MRWLRALAALVVVVSLASAAHVTYAFVQPVSGPDRVAAQVAWLDRTIDDGAPQRMQALFPEGAFFTQVLTGLAAASVDDEPTVAAMLAASAEPSVKDGFGTIAALDGGTFYRGWRLLLLAEQARLTGQGHRELLAEADAVRHALDAAATGVPPSYPEQYWPCDAVVAMAAVLRAHEAAHQPLHPVALADWRTKLNRLRDPASGLLGHQIDVFGHVLEGPRGSSQAIIQAYWPDIDPQGAAEQWQRFTGLFLVREWGLVGVREHPIGTDAAGDVDSGPLIAGVSASASAVTLAAARRNGDADLAATLDHEAEYLGLPLEWFGRTPVRVRVAARGRRVRGVGPWRTAQAGALTRHAATPVVVACTGVAVTGGAGRWLAARFGQEAPVTRSRQARPAPTTVSTKPNGTHSPGRR